MDREASALSMHSVIWNEPGFNVVTGCVGVLLLFTDKSAMPRSVEMVVGAVEDVVGGLNSFGPALAVFVIALELLFGARARLACLLGGGWSSSSS